MRGGGGGFASAHLFHLASLTDFRRGLHNLSFRYKHVNAPKQEERQAIVASDHSLPAILVPLLDYALRLPLVSRISNLALTGWRVVHLAFSPRKKRKNKSGSSPRHAHCSPTHPHTHTQPQGEAFLPTSTTFLDLVPPGSPYSLPCRYAMLL